MVPPPKFRGRVEPTGFKVLVGMFGLEPLVKVMESLVTKALHTNSRQFRSMLLYSDAFLGPQELEAGAGL